MTGNSRKRPEQLARETIDTALKRLPGCRDGELLMSKRLRIYEDALRLVVLCRSHWEALAKHGQRDLGTQLKRCAPSVALNLAEGSSRYDGNARERFNTAIGSAHEVIACLEVGGAMGALEAGDVAEAVDCADKVIATLWKVVRKGHA